MYVHRVSEPTHGLSLVFFKSLFRHIPGMCINFTVETSQVLRNSSTVFRRVLARRSRFAFFWFARFAFDVLFIYSSPSSQQTARIRGHALCLPCMPPGGSEPQSHTLVSFLTKRFPLSRMHVVTFVVTLASVTVFPWTLWP